VATTTWSYPIPAGLENLYQIDLRATDMLGNVAISANLWRGMIDTTNPRVVMTATATGASYRDAGGQVRYAVRYLCAAVDRNLDEASFDCPGEGVAEATRTFATPPELQALFPDLTIRNGLAISYTLWQAGGSPGAMAVACDTLGRCAQATSAPVGADAPAAPVAPRAVIVAPAEGAYVAGSSAVSVTVAAEATAPLKTVAISLDGALVQTLEFAQGDAITQTQRTVSVAVPTEGPHTLVAQATDWNGATQTQPFAVSFTLDTAPPAVAIDATALSAADTWQPRSGMLRFNGTASDSIGLAAVQVRVDDGEFVDATFGNGLWQTALYVPDPEGRTLAVTVRATDRAGRVSELSQLIAAAISAPDAPDTALTGTPANPSNTTTASFTFVGSAGAAVFECQLDEGAYRPCASPQSIDDLSAGSHTFRVRAIDSRGFVDLSPASFAWTINAVQPATTITAQPDNPTTARSATFTFTGDGTAVAFECALDGGAYTPCTSPQPYGDLADGVHTFRVRARNAASQAGSAARVTWTVQNAAPVAADQRVIVLRNQVTAITLAAIDSGPLRFSVLTPPAHGVLGGSAPALLYTPDRDYLGADSFTFRVSDGQGATATGTVTITVATSLAGPGTLYLPAVYR